MLSTRNSIISRPGDRREFLGHVTDLLRIDVRSGDLYQRFPQHREHHQRTRPIAQRHTDIAPPSPGAGTKLSEKLPQWDLAHMYAPQCQRCQNPLIHDGQTVVGHQA